MAYGAPELGPLLKSLSVPMCHVWGEGWAASGRLHRCSLFACGTHTDSDPILRHQTKLPHATRRSISNSKKRGESTSTATLVLGTYLSLSTADVADPARVGADPRIAIRSAA